MKPLDKEQIEIISQNINILVTATKHINNTDLRLPGHLEKWREISREAKRNLTQMGLKLPAAL